jgi:hypothetical protein
MTITPLTSVLPGLVPGIHGAAFQPPSGCQTSRDRALVTPAVSLGEDVARNMTPIRRLKGRAMGPRNKSGGNGMVGAYAYLSAYGL